MSALYYPLVYITTFLLINLVSAMLIVSTSILSTQTSPGMFSSSPKMTIATKFDSRKKDSTHTFAANYVQKPTRRGRAAHVSFNRHPFNRDKALIQRNFSSGNGDSLLIPYGYKTSSHTGDDRGALEAVLKLYTAIKQRSLREVSNVIGEECRCFCNFIPYFLPFYGKKQVMELFSYIMKYMGEHIEFVVQPTLHDGMTVSVKWRLEWAKTHMPLGKGFSFYVCHTYQGKVVIKHMEMFMEPVIHIEPLRMKMMRLLTPLLEKIGPPKGKLEKIMYLLFGLVFTVAVLLMYRFFLG